MAKLPSGQWSAPAFFNWGAGEAGPTLGECPAADMCMHVADRWWLGHMHAAFVGSSLLVFEAGCDLLPHTAACSCLAYLWFLSTFRSLSYLQCDCFEHWGGAEAVHNLRAQVQVWCWPGGRQCAELAKT